MKTYTINASNWTGENVTYKVYANGDLGIYGYRFKYTNKGSSYPPTAEFRSLCSCFKDGDEWTAMAYGMDLYREGKTPHEAAAKVAANLI